MMAKIAISMNDGNKLTLEKEDYHGFFTRPLGWDELEKKFMRLTSDVISEQLQEQILSVISDFENKDVQDLTNLIQKAELVEM